MAKIEFDIKYRPRIESGECRVETRDGRDVRILCWDRMVLDFPIIALERDALGLEHLRECNSIGIARGTAKRYVIVLPDPGMDDLSDFEKALMETILDAKTIQYADDLAEYDHIREAAANLLSIAKATVAKEIESRPKAKKTSTDAIQDLFIAYPQLNQSKLAQAIGVSQPYINKIIKKVGPVNGSDITACIGEGCPIRNTCKCYLAHKEAEKEGSGGKTVQHFVDVPYDNELRGCAFYWKKQ